MSTATIHRLPVASARRRTACTASAEDGNAHLFCVRQSHPDDPWHIDPDKGEWQVVQRRTGELIA